MTPPLPPPPSPYQAVGAAEGVRRLVKHFYDWMEEHEPALAALHALDPAGRVPVSTRERFAAFLAGWLGGPDDYVRENGHPRLRLRHRHVAIDGAASQAWMRCMDSALAAAALAPDTRAWLSVRLAEVADFLRNSPDPQDEPATAIGKPRKKAP